MSETTARPEWRTAFLRRLRPGRQVTAARATPAPRPQSRAADERRSLATGLLRLLPSP
jgi:hypothetical protein